MTVVAVAILDRDNWDANTDIIVVADPAHRRLTWVPRDLWCPRLGDRIGRAFAIGQGPALLAALGKLGLPCKGLICLRRSASEAALSAASVTVPVVERIDFWYPLHPTQPIEAGRKAIFFQPPEERLSGERLHQWIGARFMVNRPGSDLFRLRRQQVLLRALLESGFDFGRALTDASLLRVCGEDPIPILALIDTSWAMTTLDRVRGATINGKAVLLLEPRWWWAARRLFRFLAAPGRRA